MATHLTVTGTTHLSPSLLRVHLRSDDLSAFVGSEFTDRYVKLVFPVDGRPLPEPLDMRALRGTLPPEQLPVVRTYTALSPDVAAGTLDIDFVVHGDEGVAGPWAARARPGDTLVANGPGGGYRPDPGADWHLLVADESALPAVTAALADLGPDAVVHVVALVDSGEHEVALPVPEAGSVTWVRRTTGGDLAEAVAALAFPSGRVHAFVHGEAEVVMRRIRPLLLRERGVRREDLSISGYWRDGRTEEGFREWKSALAREEAAG